MKLDEILSGDRALLYMERYVDEGTKSYSPFAGRSEAAPEFRPGSHRPGFELITVRVPRDRVSIVQADPASALLARYVRDQEVLFAIHPETWASADVEHLADLRALPRGEPIRVAPTASTRTVLTLGPASHVPAHFLKLHYPRRISRFDRQLRRKHIHNSVAITRELAQLGGDELAYLPDVLGLIFGDGDQAWGFLVRERAPRPFATPSFLVPCFALFGGDLDHPHDPPLLIQLLERLGADPQAFVLDQIMIPVVECWAKVARERGILLESHAQNTLLELDEHLRPRRVVHRDFDVWIDADARRRAGLAEPFIDATIDGGTGRLGERYYSLVYDRFIGHEFFDYLLAMLARFHAIDRDAIRERVRQAFHRAFPDADRCFPARTMYYFSNEPKQGEEATLVDLNQPPEWR